MGLLKRFKDRRQNRKVERIVRQQLERPIANIQPSQLAREADELPRGLKRQHKLQVRRGYRFPALRGIMSSNQRQILAESVATRFYAEAEDERRRQQAEDRLYGSVG